MYLRTLSSRILTASLMLVLACEQASAALGVTRWIHLGSRGSAPEIDGPAGLAALAVVMSAGMIIYNRYRKK